MQRVLRTPDIRCLAMYSQLSDSIIIVWRPLGSSRNKTRVFVSLIFSTSRFQSSFTDTGGLPLQMSNLRADISAHFRSRSPFSIVVW